MTLFSKKRPDGKLVQDGDPMMHIMPYIMRGRNESCIYYKDCVEIENMQRYIREKRREGKRITIFNLIVTSMLHLIYERPHLNRFVAGRRLYDHNSFDVLYIVKTSLSDDANESVARVTFDEHDNIFTISESMKNIIDQIKGGEVEKWDDKLISFCTKLPRWTLRAIANILRWADFHGLLPESLTKQIPMYSSVFISHLGSIGGGSPFHHLYEFGTVSIFVTIGKVYEKPFKNMYGQLEWRKVVDLCFTIDERICDGFYLVKSLKYLNSLFRYPELLELSPEALKQLSDEERKDLERKLDRANRDGSTLVMRREDLSDKLEVFVEYEKESSDREESQLSNFPY